MIVCALKAHSFYMTNRRLDLLKKRLSREGILLTPTPQAETTTAQHTPSPDASAIAAAAAAVEAKADGTRLRRRSSSGQTPTEPLSPISEQSALRRNSRYAEMYPNNSTYI